MRNIFYEIDEMLRSQEKMWKHKDMSGTTANVCVLTPTHIICANCGMFS